MDNTTLDSADLTDARVILVTVSGLICIPWILIGNIITLIAVCGIKIERQKKQIISLLISNIYNGIITLPIVLLQWHRLEIFDNHLVCVFSFALSDFGDFILATFSAVLTINMFLTFKYPFKSETFLRLETVVILMQWIIPVCYTGTVFAIMSRDMDVEEDGCHWGDLPIWYQIVNTALLVLLTSVPFVLSVAILCLAWKQVGAVTAMEMSTQAAPSSRSVGMKVKHRRLAKLTVGAFLLIWAPLAITEIIAYSDMDHDPDELEVIYFFIVCLKVSFPLFYSYTFSGVKPQVMLMLKTLHIWKKRDEKKAGDVVEITEITTVSN